MMDLKKVWDEWDIRGLIILSLSLQAILIIAAPLRKRTGNKFVAVPLWSAYLLADWVATFALGLIAKGQGRRERSGAFANPDYLLAFWAPFLLAHLGGPDTITAFALEDNELWLRHLLLLVFHCGTVAYLFIQTLSKNKLWIPTLLMFVAGIIKYSERARSLYLASLRRFRDSLLALKKPDPGPDYAKLMDEFISKREANIPIRIETSQEPKAVPKDNDEVPLKEDLDVVRYAYSFFQTFKGLIADLIIGYRERDQSRTFFRDRTARDAFKVVEVELTFFYEILYTKVRVVQGKYGYFFRFVSFVFTVAALVLFFVVIDKQGFHEFDVGITYTLLLGAIALDLIAFLMVLFSDWTAVALSKSDNPSIFIRILRKFLNVNRKRWPQNSAQHCFCSLGWFMQIVRRRWSESISQFDLVHYCLHPRSAWWEKFIGTFGLTNMLDGLKYVETVDFTNDLRDLIFEELKMKSEMTYDLEDAREINSARGDWVLLFEGCSELLPWINEVDSDESILLWHIATELCSHSCEAGTDVNANNSGNAYKKDYRGLSKVLSDYMLYLLIMQSTMMSAMAGFGHVRFRDTCAEAKKFFCRRKIGKAEEEKKWRLKILPVGKGFRCSKSDCFKKCCLQKQACRGILDVKTEIKPVTIKGSGSKSVLFDACMLAKELEKLGEERKWEVMSKVWVELLCYAASRCKSNTHAAQLGKGGELITLVWLLMVHFGLGDQFQISDYQPKTQIVVEK